MDERVLRRRRPWPGWSGPAATPRPWPAASPRRRWPGSGSPWARRGRRRCRRRSGRRHQPGQGRGGRRAVGAGRGRERAGRGQGAGRVRGRRGPGGPGGAAGGPGGAAPGRAGAAGPGRAGRGAGTRARPVGGGDPGGPGRGRGRAAPAGRPGDRAAGPAVRAQRNYRALRRSAGPVDPVVAEAVGALERDLDALRRATGLAEDAAGAGEPSAGRGGRGRGRGPVGPVRSGAARCRCPGGGAPTTRRRWPPGWPPRGAGAGRRLQRHQARAGFPDRSLEDQRTLLLDLCRRLARRLGAEITVVFDGAAVDPVPTHLGLGAVGLVFTDAGGTADDEIVVRAMRRLPAPGGRRHL